MSGYKHIADFIVFVQITIVVFKSFGVSRHYIFYVLQQFAMHRMSGSTYVCTITINLTFTTVLHFPIHAQFENLFTQKPSMFNKFWQTHGTPQNVHEVSFHL